MTSFKNFHAEPRYAATSWQMIASCAAYASTPKGRRRAAWDRLHGKQLSARELRDASMAKDFDLSPRLVRRSS